MPLRDYFRATISKRSSWEGVHGGWPMRIVEESATRLPDGMVAEPRMQLGSYYGIDVWTFEQHEDETPHGSGFDRRSSACTLAPPQALPAPTLNVDAKLPEQFAYEVLIFDVERDRKLVASVDSSARPTRIGP